jgi:hypothetical protein
MPAPQSAGTVLLELVIRTWNNHTWEVDEAVRALRAVDPSRQCACVDEDT